MSELRKRQREARRTLRKSQRAEKDEIRKTNRADRKATKAAVKTIKKESRNKRRDRVNDAGEDVRMSRSERRADRRATNKAGRIVKRAAKKVRKQRRKDDRIENRAERRGQRSGQKETRRIMRKITKDEKKAKKAKNSADEEALLNKKVNAIKHQKVVDAYKPVNSNTRPVNTKEQNEADAAYYQSDEDKAKNSDANRIKKDPPEVASTVNDKMSFSEAYRAQRNANKASKTGHMDKKGNFTWRGKTYNTESKSEKDKRTGKTAKAKAAAEKAKAEKLAKTQREAELKKKAQAVIKKNQEVLEAAQREIDAASKKSSNRGTSNIHRDGIIAGGGACFSAGTLIETSNGQIPIEMIKIDDEVKSYNTKTKEIELAKVDELFVHEDCGDGLLLNGIIKTTTNHPFYVSGEWVEAGDLKLGDKILHVDGLTHEITSMEVNTDTQTVYNFEVPGNHNYFAEGYLVHNKQKKGGVRKSKYEKGGFLEPGIERLFED
tara:strand:+ start:5223 stop:6695 length:1473 start_codon:yes stop_codon:yes gene_type:complete